jgi:hypothetical protein
MTWAIVFFGASLVFTLGFHLGQRIGYRNCWDEMSQWNQLPFERDHLPHAPAMFER